MPTLTQSAVGVARIILLSGLFPFVAAAQGVTPIGEAEAGLVVPLNQVGSAQGYAGTLNTAAMFGAGVGARLNNISVVIAGSKTVGQKIRVRGCSAGVCSSQTYAADNMKVSIASRLQVTDVLAFYAGPLLAIYREADPCAGNCGINAFKGLGREWGVVIGSRINVRSSNTGNLFVDIGIHVLRFVPRPAFSDDTHTYSQSVLSLGWLTR